MDEAKRVLREAFASALSANNNTADGTERPSVVINGPVTVNVFAPTGEGATVDAEPSRLVSRGQVVGRSQVLSSTLRLVEFDALVGRRIHRYRS